MLKYSTLEIITEFKKTHGNRYDYSKFEYLGNRVKSIIICPLHGEFHQHSNSHLSGSGCKKCFLERNTMNFISKGWEANLKKKEKEFYFRMSEKEPVT